MAKSGEGLSDRLFTRRVLIVLALCTVFYIAWQLRAVLLMLFGAVVVASIFRALADRLRGWFKLHDSVAVGLSVLIILGIAGGLVWLFAAHFAGQFAGLRENLPRAWQSF